MARREGMKKVHGPGPDGIYGSKGAARSSGRREHEKRDRVPTVAKGGGGVGGGLGGGLQQDVSYVGTLSIYLARHVISLSGLGGPCHLCQA